MSREGKTVCLRGAADRQHEDSHDAARDPRRRNHRRVRGHSAAGCELN